jgi:hypothetical protein
MKNRVTMRDIVTRLRSLKMKKTVLCAFLAVIMCLTVSISSADTIWDYEAVLADGNGSHPLVNAPAYDGDENLIEANKVTIEGVALAGMDELWNSASQYIIMMQDETYDRGGMEIWAGNFGWYQPPVTWRPAQYVSFSEGDRVRVTGFLGDHAGKVFINDRHCNDLDVCFTVEVIGHPGLPDPELIPSISNCNYFDQTRNDGGERYQTRFTMLHGVEITAGTWANGSTLTIEDSTGSTALYLVPMGTFSGSAPTGKISVVGIYDQEDAGSGTPVVYHNNYRMMLKSSDDVAEAVDACREVRNIADDTQIALANKVVSRVYSGYFFIQDAERSGGVKVISDRLVTPGDDVSIMGTVSTVGDEKVITARYVVKSRNAAKPLFVNGQTLHGQSGLDVFGLLVRCVGHIGNDLGSGLYEFIDDASNVIQLDSNGYAVPELGTFVTVTAVASGDSTMPILLLGSAGDIQPVE